MMGYPDSDKLRSEALHQDQILLFSSHLVYLYQFRNPQKETKEKHQIQQAFRSELLFLSALRFLFVIQFQKIHSRSQKSFQFVAVFQTKRSLCWMYFASTGCCSKTVRHNKNVVKIFFFIFHFLLYMFASKAFACDFTFLHHRQ